jgi:phosphoenolpyruvate---glycerone phosphotransferase subunit DhaM
VRGILLISHSADIVNGLYHLLYEVAKDVPMTMAGGLDDGKIGTTFDEISNAIESNEADEIYAFYDLGSAKLNLEMAIEASTKKVTIYDVALIEGSYIAAALLQTGVDDETIKANLAPLTIK